MLTFSFLAARGRTKKREETESRELRKFASDLAHTHTPGRSQHSSPARCTPRAASFFFSVRWLLVLLILSALSTRFAGPVPAVEPLPKEIVPCVCVNFEFVQTAYRHGEVIDCRTVWLHVIPCEWPCGSNKFNFSFLLLHSVVDWVVCINCWRK